MGGIFQRNRDQNECVGKGTEGIIKAMKWKKLDLDSNLESFHRNKNSAKGRENRVRISCLF